MKGHGRWGSIGLRVSISLVIHGFSLSVMRLNAANSGLYCYIVRLVFLQAKQIERVKGRETKRDQKNENAISFLLTAEVILQTTEECGLNTVWVNVRPEIWDINIYQSMSVSYILFI